MDDPLLGELRRLAQEVDAVPDQVTGYARASLGWRRVDAELAELLSDSRLEAVAGVRSAEARVRSVTFGADDLEVAIEIHELESGIRILGQLAPAVAAAIEVQRDDGTVAASAETDTLGRFRIEFEPAGRIRLLVRREPPASTVETSWLGL